MGNTYTYSKDEFIKENLNIIKFKFNGEKIKGNNNNDIEWCQIEKSLEYLYEIKYNGNYEINEQLDILPTEIDFYI